MKAQLAAGADHPPQLGERLLLVVHQAEHESMRRRLRVSRLLPAAPSGTVTRPGSLSAAKAPSNPRSRGGFKALAVQEALRSLDLPVFQMDVTALPRPPHIHAADAIATLGRYLG